MSYQVFTWLPFVFNRFILRKEVKLVSLYKFRGSRGDSVHYDTLPSVPQAIDA